MYLTHARLICLYYQTHIIGLHQTRVPRYPGLKAAKPVNPGLKNTPRVCIPYTPPTRPSHATAQLSHTDSVNCEQNSQLAHDNCRWVRSHRRHDATLTRCWQTCLDSLKLSPTSRAWILYTPPTRLNWTVASRRRCVLSLSNLPAVLCLLLWKVKSTVP